MGQVFLLRGRRVVRVNGTQPPPAPTRPKPPSTRILRYRVPVNSLCGCATLIGPSRTRTLSLRLLRTAQKCFVTSLASGTSSIHTMKLVCTGVGHLPGTVELPHRSEERRVGKECRSRCDWSSDVCSSDLKCFVTSLASGTSSIHTMKLVCTGVGHLPGTVELPH